MNITPYSKNAKKHPQKQIDQLAAIVKEVGWRQPILVNQNGVIVAGHGRWETYQQNQDSLKEPWVIDDAGKNIMGEAETTPLTEEQEKAYRLADNKLAETDVDMGLVLEELKELEELAPLTGYDTDLLIEPDEADDEVPEVPEEPRSKLGDLYELGEHRVLCGDSNLTEDIETLMAGSKATAVVTDPPYGIGIDGQKKSVSKNPKHNRKYHEDRGWDSKRPSKEIFEYLVSLHVPSVIWGGNYFADLLPPTRGWIYWDKGQNGLTMSDGELAWTTEDKPLRATTVNRGALQGSVHPTQKPLQVIEYSLHFLSVPLQGIVLDLFLGSGSTLIAAEKTGRICYGMELDPKYVDVIVQRYIDYTGNATIKKNGQEIIWTQNKEKTRSS